MSFQFSPDREYYWDGAQWVRAVSPDGRWRWDGIAWRPAPAQPRTNRRTAALIAIVALVVLLLGGVGAFVVSRAFALEQSGLAGFGVVCKGSADPAGSPVSSGDTVCGYRLGATQVAASCDGPQIPAGTRAWQEAKNESNATEYDMRVDPEGCDLDTPLGTTIWLQTAQPTGPDVVVLSDFVPHTDWGAIGVELACNDATCVNFYIDPAGVYRLDEMRAYGQWSTVARGALPPFTISHLNRLNRMVVRYRDRSVQAFLDGYQVVRATTSLLHAAGYVSVYSNDVVGTEPALVHVRTFDVFAST